MKDDPPLPSLAKLDEKLRAAEAKRRKTKTRSEIQGQGLGFALRIGVEIVAALIVGVGIGLLLDWWLGTKPWFPLLFFVLGAAAGFMNVFRSSEERSVGKEGVSTGRSRWWTDR